MYKNTVKTTIILYTRIGTGTYPRIFAVHRQQVSVINHIYLWANHRSALNITYLKITNIFALFIIIIIRTYYHFLPVRLIARTYFQQHSFTSVFCTLKTNKQKKTFPMYSIFHHMLYGIPKFTGTQCSLRVFDFSGAGGVPL